MIDFLKKILFFSLVFFFIEKIFFVFLVISPTLEKDTRLEKILNGEINKDLIVLGSSRGARNIIASQIEDSLNISAYNLSYPASDIEFHEFLLRSLIKFNKPPKIVLLSIDDPSSLLPSESINFRLDRLYPLARYNHINNEMVKRKKKTILSHFLILERINKRNFDLKKKDFSELDTIADCGSMPISFQKENTDFLYGTISKYETKEELPEKIEAFKKIQNYCLTNNIELFLIFPPNYRPHNISFENRIRELSDPKTSIFVYDTLNVVYKDKSYYYDKGHLQLRGAIIFTNEIIKELEKVRNS